MQVEIATNRNTSIMMERHFSLGYPSGSKSYLFPIGIVISSWLVFLSAFTNIFGIINLEISIVGLVIFVIFGVISVDCDISHPFVLFNIIFTIYSISTPIINIMGEYIYCKSYASNFDYVQIIFTEYLALLAFSLIVSPKLVTYNISSFAKRINKAVYLYNGIYYVLIAAIIISLIQLIMLKEAGVQSKIDKISEFSQVNYLGFAWTVITVSVTALLVHSRLQAKRYPFLFISIISTYILLALLISGERGPLFRYVLTLAVATHVLYGKIKFRYFVIALFAGIYLSTIAGPFKMFLMSNLRLTDIPGMLKFEYSDVLLNLMGGEFRSASENLGVVLQAIPSSLPFLYGKSLLFDLIRSVIPSFLVSPETIPTTVYWFNDTFFSSLLAKGGGVGFSLVGTGYVNFGYPGIVGLFLLVGWLIKKLYEYSAKNVVFLICYLSIMPLLAYCIRADLAILISQGLKHILLPIGLMIVIGKCMGKTKMMIPRVQSSSIQL
jgi:oligosaccharide repeat unit polymerase